MITFGTHLNFEDKGIPLNKKTHRYGVYSAHDGSLLGEVHWWGAWRQYVYEPVRDIIWSHECLTELAAFIKNLMDERKKK